MAHFAQLNEDNIVTNVIVVSNSNTLLNGVEDEATGIAFCQSLLGPETKWAQTSYNGSFKKQYAGIGYKYDAEKDVFIAYSPYPSWVLNANNDWEAPIAYPDDGEFYSWDEATLSWVQPENI